MKARYKANQLYQKVKYKVGAIAKSLRIRYELESGTYKLPELSTFDREKFLKSREEHKQQREQMKQVIREARENKDEKPAGQV